MKVISSDRSDLTETQWAHKKDPGKKLLFGLGVDVLTAGFSRADSDTHFSLWIW